MAARKTGPRKAPAKPAHNRKRTPKPVARKPSVRRAPPKVVDAVERDLAELAKRAPELANSGLAASALALAYELDRPRNSATSKATAARALREALDQLRQLTPPAKEKDKVDELSSRRASRRAGGAAS